MVWRYPYGIAGFKASIGGIVAIMAISISFILAVVGVYGLAGMLSQAKVRRRKHCLSVVRVEI